MKEQVPVTVIDDAGNQVFQNLMIVNSKTKENAIHIFELNRNRNPNMFPEVVEYPLHVRIGN